MTIRQMTSAEAAWCAGIMEAQGSFTTRKIYRPLERELGYRYELRSRVMERALLRFAKYTGLKINAIKRGKVYVKGFSISGDTLDELMRQLWPHLTADPRRAYADVRKASQASVFAINLDVSQL